LSVVITDPTVSAGVLAGGTEDRKGFSVASAGDIAVAATANPASSNKLRLVKVAALSFASVPSFRLLGIHALLRLRKFYWLGVARQIHTIMCVEEKAAFL